MELLEPVFTHQRRDQQAFDDRPVHVLAAQLLVAAVVLDADHAVAPAHQRGVEGAAPEVVDQPARVVGVGALLETVGGGGGHRLLHEGTHLQAGQPRGALGGFDLRTAEVGRYGDDGGTQVLVQPLLDVALQVHQHLGRQFLGQQALAGGGEEVALVVAHLALEFDLRVGSIAFMLVLGALPHVFAALGVEPHRRRRGFAVLGVLDDLAAAGGEDRDLAIGGAQINAEVDGAARHGVWCFLWLVCEGDRPSRFCTRCGGGICSAAFTAAGTPGSRPAPRPTARARRRRRRWA